METEFSWQNTKTEYPAVNADTQNSKNNSPKKKVLPLIVNLLRENTQKDKIKRQIIVKGEEDLAVLPCILIAPQETIILYGQPNEGLVYLKACDVVEKAKKLMSYNKL